jgi:hypothetical protein
MATADRDYLAAYVRAQPSRQSNESLSDYLRRVGVDDSAPTGAPASPAGVGPTGTQPLPNATAQAAQAQRQYQAQQAQAAKAAKLAADAEARKQGARDASLIGKGMYAAGIVPNKLADTVENIQNWIATRPTPGGRGGMLLLLLLFGAFIIPVSQGGYTRAQLLWLTLLGRTEIDDSGEPDNGGYPKAPPAGPPDGKPKPPGPIDPGGKTNMTNLTAQPLPFTLPLPGGAGGISLPK